MINRSLRLAPNNVEGIRCRGRRRADQRFKHVGRLLLNLLQRREIANGRVETSQGGQSILG